MACLTLRLASSLAAISMMAACAPSADEGVPLARKWVGVCVKGDATALKVTDAVLASSSGDPKVDEEMLRLARTLKLPGHGKPDRWGGVWLRSGLEAQGAEEPDFPNLNCDRLDEPGGHR